MEDSLTVPNVMIDLKQMAMVMVKMGTVVREMGMEPLEIKDKVEEILEVHPMVEVEDEVSLTKVLTFDIQEK